MLKSLVLLTAFFTFVQLISSFPQTRLTCPASNFASPSRPLPCVRPNSTLRCEQLIHDMYTQLLDFVNYELTQQQIIIDKVLHDEHIVRPSNPNTSSHWPQQLARLNNFAANATEQLKEPQPAGEPISIADKYLYLLQKIFVFVEFERIAEPNQLNALDDAIILSLQRNGLEELKRNMLRRHYKFMGDFLKSVESYLSTLSDVERTEQHELVSWFEHYQKENAEQRAHDVFTQFVQLFVKI